MTTNQKAQQAIDAALYPHHGMISTDAAQNILEGLRESGLIVVEPEQAQETIAAELWLRDEPTAPWHTAPKWRADAYRNEAGQIIAALAGKGEADPGGLKANQGPDTQDQTVSSHPAA